MPSDSVILLTITDPQPGQLTAEQLNIYLEMLSIIQDFARLMDRASLQFLHSDTVMIREVYLLQHQYYTVQWRLAIYHVRDWLSSLGVQQQYPASFHPVVDAVPDARGPTVSGRSGAGASIGPDRRTL